MAGHSEFAVLHACGWRLCTPVVVSSLRCQRISPSKLRVRRRCTHVGQIAAVVEQQIGRPAPRSGNGAVDAVDVFLFRFALPGKHRHASPGNGGGGVILGGKPVTRRPAHFRAQFHERFDQYRGLHGHVQATGDARAGQWLLLAVLFHQRHQAGHFAAGDGDFALAVIGQRQIGHAMVSAQRGYGAAGHVRPPWLRARRRPAPPPYRFPPN